MCIYLIEGGAEGRNPPPLTLLKRNQLLLLVNGNKLHLRLQGKLNMFLPFLFPSLSPQQTKQCYTTSKPVRSKFTKSKRLKL